MRAYWFSTVKKLVLDDFLFSFVEEGCVLNFPEMVLPIRFENKWCGCVCSMEILKMPADFYRISEREKKALLAEMAKRRDFLKRTRKSAALECNSLN